ncbi:MAG: hypothetical protein VXW27_10310, partial [Pseudomonadota bacterium]|nr:hypothetical protein [Pseudomonadota bacterium]
GDARGQVADDTQLVDVGAQPPLEVRDVERRERAPPLGGRQVAPRAREQKASARASRLSLASVVQPSPENNPCDAPLRARAVCEAALVAAKTSKHRERESEREISSARARRRAGWPSAAR